MKPIKKQKKDTLFFKKWSKIVKKNNNITPKMYEKFNVKRGLRNNNGSGVLVGLTEIGDVHGYIIDENENIPVEGRLLYRGIEINDLVNGFQKEKRYGFEEIIFLLLFGELPTKNELKQFCHVLDNKRELPEGFTENMILKAPSNDIMNKLARSVLVSYSFNKNPESRRLDCILKQCIELIARFPTIIAYSYHAKEHYHKEKSLYIHNPKEGIGTAENFLHLVRHNSKYTKTEAELLDLALILHAEHGGGNNSTFSTHLISSADTDVYSSIAAAVGSLKGSKHGGANIHVLNMMNDIKKKVKDWTNEKQVSGYILKIMNKKAFDRTGLVYGIGHAVYTLSDPRAVILKKHAARLAKEKGKEEEYQLYNLVEKLTPDIYKEVKKTKKIISANVDFYSGLVYSMLDIPADLFTPIFAMARIAGWASHLLEERVSGGKIMRPAYKNVSKTYHYTPLTKRIKLNLI